MALATLMTRAIRRRGDTIESIYREFGSSPWTAADLRAAGIPGVNPGWITGLRGCGIVERVERRPHGNVWRLSPRVVAHYASKEVRA